MSFDLTRGFWMIFLATKGMSLVQLGILEGAFHVTSLLMETPTGAIADLFGRKISRILGRVFLMANILLTLFGTNFYHFFISFILCAIGWNLESGAGDAMVYDSLAELKEEDRYMSVNGRLEAVYQVAQAGAFMVAGYIALVSYERLYVGQVILISVAILIATLFRETEINKPDHRPVGFISAMKQQYVGSFSVLKGNRRLLYFIALINALSIFTTTSFFYLQIFCKQNGMPESTMGILFALSGGIATFGGVLAARIEQRVKERKLLYGLPIVFMILIWGMTRFQTAIIAFAAIGFVDSLMYVVYSDYINRLLPSDKRATLLSFSSMIFSLFMILLFPAFGWIGEQFSIETAFVVMASLSTLLALGNLFFLRLTR